MEKKIKNYSGSSIIAVFRTHANMDGRNLLLYFYTYSWLCNRDQVEFSKYVDNISGTEIICIWSFILYLLNVGAYPKDYERLIVQATV